jgi:hypothetical protein
VLCVGFAAVELDRRIDVSLKQSFLIEANNDPLVFFQLLNVGRHRYSPYLRIIRVVVLLASMLLRNRSWMLAQRRDLHFHEGIKGERIQDFVEFGGTFDIENADVCELTRHAPEMQPLSLFLQDFGPLMLQFGQPLDLLGIRIVRDAHSYEYVEQHRWTPNREIEVYARDTGL